MYTQIFQLFFQIKTSHIYKIKNRPRSSVKQKMFCCFFYQFYFNSAHIYKICMHIYVYPGYILVKVINLVD